MKLNPYGDSNSYTEKEKNIEFLKNNLGDKRVFLLCNEKTRANLRGRDSMERFKNGKKGLYPDLGILYGISDVEGYEAVDIKRHYDLGHIVMRAGKKRKSPVVDLLGVKYILTFWRLDRKFKFIYDDYVWIHENPDCLPRAFFINNAKFVQDEYDSLNEMMDVNFDPASYVIIEDEELRAKSEEQRAKSKIIPAEMKYLSPNIVSISATCGTNGYVVLTDMYYSGWKAYVDGKETKIYPAYHALRAVKVQKGNHNILFKYKPTSLKIGAIITLLSLFVSILFLLRGYKII
jgi:hypothetical protein